MAGRSLVVGRSGPPVRLDGQCAGLIGFPARPTERVAGLWTTFCSAAAGLLGLGLRRSAALAACTY